MGTFPDADTPGAVWSGRLLDATLRDGGYAIAFQFDHVFVAKLLACLAGTPVDLVEIGHGFGFEAERAGHAACTIDLDGWYELAAGHLGSTPWGMFAQPAFSRLSTLERLGAAGMSFVRVGMASEKVPETLDYLHRAVDLCPRVYLNLMKTSDIPAADLPGLLRDLPDGLAGVYVVDSYGTMLPEDVERYVRVLGGLFQEVGFHGHDNLGMANANSMAAFAAGASIVDGTLNGIGRGAGNAEIESLAAILAKRGEDRYGYRALADLAEMCRTAMDVIPDNRSMQVLGGVIGVHSDLFGEIEKASAELGVSAAAVMDEAVRLARYAPNRSDVSAAARTVARAHRPAAQPVPEAR